MAWVRFRPRRYVWVAPSTLYANWVCFYFTLLQTIFSAGTTVVPSQQRPECDLIQFDLVSSKLIDRVDLIMNSRWSQFARNFVAPSWLTNCPWDSGEEINYARIECVRSCDQKPYLHNETKGGICIKIEFNSQKNISLLQHGRRFFVFFLQHGRRDVMWTHPIKPLSLRVAGNVSKK